ncbi:hypothetical protein IKM56_02705 [Candidatus Saccharibacteria bacterium]|nr:hypothetical protein [Candidatus Saccharibacteria bacterium]
MDNQNANGGKALPKFPFLGGKDESKVTRDGVEMTADQDVLSPMTKAQSVEVENLRAKSLVESEREKANEELRRIEEYNARIRAMEEARLRAEKAKKTTVYVIIAVICVALAVATLVFVLVLLNALRRPTTYVPEEKEEKEQQYAQVEGYQCETAKCGKIAELSDGRIILRDGAYYIYDLESKEKTVTAIDNTDYYSVLPFVWGEKTYLVLDLDAGLNAIFSIADNRYVVDANYDAIYTDIESDTYKDMKWVYGKYIVASRSGGYRIIDMSANNSEKVNGSKKVFAIEHGPYFIGYESDGQRRVFNNSGTQIYLCPAENDMYARDGLLITVDPDYDYDIFGTDGESPDGYSFEDELDDQDSDTLPNYLNNGSYFKIPKE